MWNYGVPYVANIMKTTAYFAADPQGRKLFEALNGETPEIYKYLDFCFYDQVRFKESSGLRETKLGIFLGVSHHIGSIMSYWVLRASGIPMSRTTLQQVTNFRTQTEQCKKCFEMYNINIADRFNEVYI